MVRPPFSEDDFPPYWCEWCRRDLVPELVYGEDGELRGAVYVHFNVPHPAKRVEDGGEVTQ